MSMSMCLDLRVYVDDHLEISLENQVFIISDG